jgi:RNA polymerase sigma-70 factor (ECF subfamily)
MVALVMTLHPDDALVTASRRGDRAAFSDLVTRHQDRVYRLCVRWLGDPNLAEETAQDVFLSAWRAIGNFRSEARFDTWLRRITVNKCRNRRLSHLRRARDRHDSLEGDPNTDERPPLQLVHGGPGPAARLDRTEAQDLLNRALSELDDDHRAVVLLRDLEDLTYEEIAELLDVPRGTVKSRLHRARVALAAQLAPRVGREDVF